MHMYMLGNGNLQHDQLYHLSVSYCCDNCLDFKMAFPNYWYLLMKVMITSIDDSNACCKLKLVFHNINNV